MSKRTATITPITVSLFITDSLSNHRYTQTVTSATDEAPVNTFSGALIPTEAKILEEKGTGEAVETARDASEAVLEVADEPSETQQTVEVVKDGAVLEAPMDVVSFA